MSFPAPPIPSPAEVGAAGIEILVSVPLERTVAAEVFSAFWEIARRGWPLVHRGYGRTDVNRNEAAQRFLESDFTHLVMLDADHRHPADIVERLARWVMQDADRWVVGGLNFRRGEPYEPCAFVDVDGDLLPAVKWQPGLVRVDAIGHGCILIGRQALERLPRPWWAYAYNEANVGDAYETDDIYFSRQCQRHGIMLWCDTTTTSPHLTTVEVTEETFRSWLAGNRERVNYATVHGRRVRRDLAGRAGEGPDGRRSGVLWPRVAEGA